MTTSFRVAFGREVCGTLEEGAARELLVTDGLGGYAAGTVSGLLTRRYHGLLMHATGRAGATRSLGLVALDTVVVIGDQRIRLATHEWVSGAVDPRGHEQLAWFDLDDGVPRWRYDLGPVQLEVELAMADGVCTVAVVHRLLAGEATLEVTPLCTWRDQHGDRFAGTDPAVESSSAGFVFESAYRVQGPGYQPAGAWYRGVYHREEAARGLGASEDLWAAGTFRAALSTGGALGVVATTDLESDPPDAASVLATARARSAALAARAGAEDDVGRILAVAADHFIVRTSTGPTAVAGYPWFGEWSRDLFTSYEGLFLGAGRADEGRAVLQRAAASVSEGMLANTADVGALEYNTIDATLWFVHALGRHVAHTDDLDLVGELAGTVVDILSEHLAGTRFGIGVDATTGLLRGGADGWALTWMDARVDGRPITPRAGFPVEIEALWINALGTSIELLTRVGQDVHHWSALREQALSSFGARFPLGTDGLADALTPAGLAVTERRPNQLLAAALPYGPVTEKQEVGRIVDACRKDLVTSVGLRSLSPRDPGYRGQHRGGPAERDAAYHQGTVWPWLIGPYADAVRRAGGDTTQILDGLELHLSEFGLGSVSETMDGDAPHAATGCPFQAWSVAELIRSRARRPDVASPGSR